MRIEYLKEIRQKVVDAGIMLAHSGMTIGTYGNISCRVDKSCIAITPSGRDFEKITPENIVVTDLAGEKLGGTLLPSSELPLHLEIYKNFPEARAIVHTHSIYASALAAAHKELPPVTEELAQAVGGAVRCSDYSIAGTNELGQNAVKAMEGGRSAALLANHGAVCWGRDLKEALATAQILERAAQIFCIASSLGKPVSLEDKKVESLRDFYLNHYSKRQRGEE